MKTGDIYETSTDGMYIIGINTFERMAVKVIRPVGRRCDEVYMKSINIDPMTTPTKSKPGIKFAKSDGINAICTNIGGSYTREIYTTKGRSVLVILEDQPNYEGLALSEFCRDVLYHKCGFGDSLIHQVGRLGECCGQKSKSGKAKFELMMEGFHMEFDRVYSHETVSMIEKYIRGLNERCSG